MYEYQYFVEKGFRVIGISLRGFGKSDRPYGKYDFDVFSDDIKVVLEKLKINNAVLGGFSMGGAVVKHYMAKYNGAHVSNWHFSPLLHLHGNSVRGFLMAPQMKLRQG